MSSSLQGGSVLAGNEPAPHSDAAESIPALRAELDVLDEHLVALLNERAELSLAVRRLKEDAHAGRFDGRFTGRFDPKREADIFTHVCAVNKGPLYAEHVREIYASILKVMKKLSA